MKKEEIYEILKKEISERFKVPEDTITPEFNFLNDVNADSIDFVELVIEIEDRFNLEIPDDSLDDLKSLQNVTDFVFENQN